MSEIAREDARASRTPSTCPATRSLTSTNITNVGRHVRDSRAVRGARRASRSCGATRSPTELREAVSREIQEAQVGRLRRPAGRRPGQHRRLQASGAGPRRRRAARRCKARCRTWPTQGNSQPRPGRPVQQLQRQPAAALRRRRPRQGQGAGRVARATCSTRCRPIWARPMSTTSPVQPQLAGQRPGRRRATACSSRTSASSKVRNADGRDGAAGDADQGQRRQRARRSSTTTTCIPSAEINGNTAPGISSGQAIAIMDELAKQELPSTHGLRVDRADAPADPGRQGPAHQAGLPAGGASSCSWCWRPSTRAGRCRWRSS